ncbi:response regulator transcription factor [Exiguobacterium sp. TDN 0502]|uniref:response regulator transcription factor n=1 Tax=Exiguobacterium sp. TDN 0502 TaxID=3420731 RepID=UPI003D76E61A
MEKILIVDDEVRMRQLLKLYLEPVGYACSMASDGEEALDKVKKETFDLILLDVMMPLFDGFEVCKKIADTYPDLPIIMITALDDAESIVKGLDAGAADYVTKPFNGDVLLARVRSVLRRKPKQAILYEGLVFDEANELILLNGKAVDFTPKAHALMRLFLQHPGRLFNRLELYEFVWSYTSESDPRTVDSHIKMIREKLRALDYPIDQHLKTFWGRGYRWNETDEDANV